jgi:oxygen-independent coproporphyrinogen-3 oxidase
MLGLYVHIPFCRQKCFYCNFFSIKYDVSLADRYIESLIKHSQQFKNEKINSIYIGGGTPSILSFRQLQNLLQSLNDTFNVLELKEYTFELNPESISKEKMILLKDFGVNRLSIGLQAVEAKTLKYLGRIHDFKSFCSAYNIARNEGFDNINIDLIYGLPNQTVSEWVESLKKVLLFNSEHLSLYPLTIEQNTPFYKNNIVTDDNLQREMYDKTVEILEYSGYIHYEISYWYKKGKEAVHNTNYWRNKEYIGLGAGASGYFKRDRYKNVGDVEKYIDFIGDDIDCRVEKEYINEKLYTTEAIILGLRLLNEGMDINSFRSPQQQNALRECLDGGMLVEEQSGRVKLAKEYVFVFNQVALKFI